MKWNVEISPDEYIWLHFAGVLRQISNMAAARRSNVAYGIERLVEQEPIDEAIVRHTAGVLGEFLYARMIGAPLPDLFSYGMNNPDVGGAEVKATHYKTGKLVVQVKGLKPDRRYVLVTGGPFKWAAKGWLYGHEVANREPTDGANNGRTPAYWVDQSELRKMETWE